MEGKKLDIHNHILPKNWPDLKERFLSLFKNVQKQIIDKETDDRYGYGGWVSLDHSCGGCPQPGYANMMKVSANMSFIHSDDFGDRVLPGWKLLSESGGKLLEPRGMNVIVQYPLHYRDPA